MELVEPVGILNDRLKEYFGIDTSTGNVMWRIVWSEDQYELRMTDRTPEGLQLLHPEMQLLPKYKQWIREKYVLENLVVVPEVNADELATKLSYEPIWVFMTNEKEYLPPTWEAAKFVIDAIYAAKGKKSLAKYKESEDELNPELRVNKLEKELFGNETSVGDALAHKTGIVVPGNKMN